MGPACWKRSNIRACSFGDECCPSELQPRRLCPSHTRTIDNVRKVEERLRRPVAALLDTKGPEIRTGMLPNHERSSLNQGKEFYLFFEAVEGNADRVHVDYPDLYKYLLVRKFLLTTVPSSISGGS